MADTRRVHAPGRVNLIGDHTDYTGGLVFPMAIDRGTTIEYAPQAERIELRSDADSAAVVVDLPVLLDPSLMEPAWGAYVAAMARELGSTRGVVGTVTSDIPAGAGLSSSAALECAVGLALGFDGTPIELALAAQRAEHDATGVPTGIMDQLCIAAATAGHATMIDCHHLDVIQVPIPDDVDVVVEFVTHRRLVGSPYADRVAECARAESTLGPLRLADAADVDAARAQLDEVSFRRARHVVTENQRVRDFAAALVSGDHAEAGALMTESHRSLRDDFDTSTPEMDAAVERLAGSPGVYGARMTGGGFGGCVVVLSEPGALTTGWHVRPSPGARHL
ncbi:MAG: galactokinase family protein [Ilumatobacteraceae bacterium]